MQSQNKIYREQVEKIALDNDKKQKSNYQLRKDIMEMGHDMEQILDAKGLIESERRILEIQKVKLTEENAKINEERDKLVEHLNKISIVGKEFENAFIDKNLKSLLSQ